MSAPKPLRNWPDGSVRIARTRVNMGHVIDLHTLGWSPEEIVNATPVLVIKDVREVISFYLGHRMEIDPWLAELEAIGMALLLEMDSAPEVVALKARARALRAERGEPV